MNSDATQPNQAAEHACTNSCSSSCRSGCDACQTLNCLTCCISNNCLMFLSCIRCCIPYQHRHGCQYFSPVCTSSMHNIAAAMLALSSFSFVHNIAAAPYQTSLAMQHIQACPTCSCHLIRHILSMLSCMTDIVMAHLLHQQLLAVPRLHQVLRTL